MAEVGNDTATSGSAAQSLGRALELAGKMPALASRAAVYALWSISLQASDKAAAGRVREQFRAALDQFAALLAALKEGDADLGVPTETAALLEQLVWSDESVIGAADGFVANAFFVHTQLAGPAAADLGEAHALGEQAAGPLSAALDRATEIIRAQLDAIAKEDRAKVEAGRELTARTLEKLDDLTLRIQLISVNASVEAARAGVAGAGFGVIAQEINALTSGAQTAVNEIRQGFEQV